MLGYVEVNKVTEVVVHVHPYLKNTQLSQLSFFNQHVTIHAITYCKDELQEHLHPMSRLNKLNAHKCGKRAFVLCFIKVE